MDRDKPAVGFIGLGAMGAPMARHVLAAGFPLVVSDIRQDPAAPLLKDGASWAATPRAVAQAADVILTCLPSLDTVAQVCTGPEGLLHGIAPGKAVFEMSTNAPGAVAELHAAFAEKGAHFLDAPVTGGTGGAENGKLTVFIGGDRDSFERFSPVLQTMADRLIHVGPSGTGTITKLVNNCASQSLYLLIAEVFALGLKAGAKPLPLWEALRSGAAGRRRVFDALIDEYLPGHYTPPSAALPIFQKDMTLATDLGRELDVPMPFATLALEQFSEAMARGWADKDGRIAMTLPLERLGLKVAEDPRAIADILRRDPPAASDPQHGGG